MRFSNPLSQSVKRVQEADVKDHQVANIRHGLGDLEGQHYLEVELGNLEELVVVVVQQGVEEGVVVWLQKKILRKGRFSIKNKYR